LLLFAGKERYKNGTAAFSAIQLLKSSICFVAYEQRNFALPVVITGELLGIDT
jgi:hypothetical protein